MESKPSDGNDVEKQKPSIEASSNINESFEVKETSISSVNGTLVFTYGVFFAMCVIGWINLNRCSINRLIPIYLIVAGFVGALATSLGRFGNAHLLNVSHLLIVIYCIWTCLGTYWVYTVYQPNYDSTYKDEYCNRIAYLTAFWILTLQYTLFGFFILLSGFYMLMRGDFKKI